MVNNHWLVVTGTMEWIMTFPSYWECHHPNCYSLHDFSEGWRKTHQPGDPVAFFEGGLNRKANQDGCTRKGTELLGAF